MNDLKRLLISLILGLLSGAIVFLIYWLSGGDFERGDSLGFTATSSVFIAGFFTAMTFDLLQREDK